MNKSSIVGHKFRHTHIYEKYKINFFIIFEILKRIRYEIYIFETTALTEDP